VIISVDIFVEKNREIGLYAVILKLEFYLIFLYFLERNISLIN